MSSIPTPVSEAGTPQPGDASTTMPATTPREGSTAASGMRTIKGYSLPGEGPSTLISVVTVVGLLAFWWIATHFGWIKDLFLPTPRRQPRHPCSAPVPASMNHPLTLAPIVRSVAPDAPLQPT
jgi:hypothetical protein